MGDGIHTDEHQLKTRELDHDYSPGTFFWVADLSGYCITQIEPIDDPDDDDDDNNTGAERQTADLYSEYWCEYDSNAR